MSLFDPSDIAICVRTLFSSKDNNVMSPIVRAGPAYNSLRKLSSFGYNVFIIDGGSDEEVLSKFQKTGAKIREQDSNLSGIGNATLQTLQFGLETNAKYFGLVELEKTSMISKFPYFFERLAGSNYDFLIPYRKSLSSLEENQAHYEDWGNSWWWSFTGLGLDSLNGTRLFTRENANYFLEHNMAKYGDRWEILFVPLLKAYIDGKQIDIVKVDYRHPKKQKLDEAKRKEMHLKRAEQHSALTQAEMHFYQDYYAELLGEFSGFNFVDYFTDATYAAQMTKISEKLNRFNPRLVKDSMQSGPFLNGTFYNSIFGEMPRLVDVAKFTRRTDYNINY